MNKIFWGACLFAILSLGLAGTSLGQTTSAAATPAKTSGGGPDTLELKQNTLTFKRAAITRQLREIQRCISNASNPTILRDPEGNINRVPQTDLVNCARQLAQLQRQLSSLQRQTNALAQDAQFQAVLLQDALLAAQRKVRLGQKSN